MRNIIILIAIFLLSFNFVSANGDLEGGGGTTQFTTFDSKAFDAQNGIAKPNAEISQNYVGNVKMQGSGPVRFGEDVYYLNDGDELRIDSDGNAKVQRATKIQTKDESGEETIAEGVEDGIINKDGTFEFKSIKTLKKGKTTIINGKGVKFKNGILTAEQADSFIKDNSITTNIEKLESSIDIFSVEQADSFLSDCIRIDNIKDSEFRVGNNVEVTTKSNVNLKITDCTFNEYQFSGKGKLTVDKSSDNPKYIIENGTLTKKEDGYNESIESNNSVTVETDKTLGFKCFTITPAGSYFYNDNDLRKDFAVNVPKESGIYKLCLRKNKLQQFSGYNGLADFVEKKIELNGIVNYLRYPLKNNQISSLLSSFVYKGLKDVKSLLSYDDNLLFLRNIKISNLMLNDGKISLAIPNSHLSIKEVKLEDGKVHRIIEMRQTSKEDLTQDVFLAYQSESLDSSISMNNNVLVQDNGRNKIVIYPAGHQKLNEVLK